MALEHARPGEVVSLRPLGSELATARTTALVKTDRFEAVRLVLQKGSSIAAHHVPGYFTLHCLEGGVVVGAGDEIELGAGDWVYLERGAEHSVRAIEDSSLLLTIMFDDRIGGR